jgi:ATP-binding cassette subfamily B protein AbcA/BmrA
MAYMEMKRSQGATARIAILIDSPLEEYEKERGITSIHDDIFFEDVSFSYGDKKVLKNVSFSIPEGKVTAIVGPSGGGKSTILAILQQFYQLDSGKITLGKEYSINKFHLKDWRNLFSYVAQDSPLISGTIRENIVYGVDREVTEIEIVKAAEAANALKFIKEFTNGFEADVGEGGTSLSGGQRQRIAIARAILRNAPILLLDEATASLDSQSEKAVQEAMKKLMKDHTTVMIAHDLSTIQHADQIILIDSGKVDGIGTHEKLMKTNELYKLFVQLHMGSSAS